MSSTEPASATNDLGNLILALLAPMFLWSTAGDINLSYAAAAQTVNEYRVTNRLSLMTVAKIIAFDIATLSSLSLSMYEDVSMLLALRLRGNASSLDRSGERNRRALEAGRRGVPAGLTEEPVEAAIVKAEQMVREAKARVSAAAALSRPHPAPVAEPAAVAAPAPVSASAASIFATGPAPTSSAPTSSAPNPTVPEATLSVAAPCARTEDEQRRAAWASAMTMVAEEFTEGLKDLPPAERRVEMARIAALTATAGDLVSGTAPPPVDALAAE